MDLCQLIPSLEGLEDNEDFVDPQTTLMSRIFGYLAAKDLYNVPITCVNIDWDVIAFDGHSKSQCQAMWKKILYNSRLYRSAGEILSSAIQNPNQTLDSTTRMWNKKFVSGQSDVQQSMANGEEVLDVTDKSDKATAKDELKKKREQLKAKKEEMLRYPKKPTSAYVIFCQEKLKTEGFTMAKAGAAWKELDGETLAEYKQKFAEQTAHYLEDLESYVEDNPEDAVGHELLAKAKKSSNSKSATAAGVKRNHVGSGDSSDLNSSAAFSSPSPKKKKKDKEKKKEWTGFNVYTDAKKEELGLEHPDMSDSELMQKLEKKYYKLSYKKRERYENVAKEMNEEG